MEKTLIQILEEAVIGKSIKVVQFMHPLRNVMITHLTDQYVEAEMEPKETYKEITGIEITEYEYEPASIYLLLDGDTHLMIELSTALTLNLK